MKPTLLALMLALAAFGAKKKPVAPAAQTPLDRFVAESRARSLEAQPAAPGSIWVPGSRLADAARDLRASQVDDVLTILVVENASAVAKGATKTQRTSSAKYSVSAAAGITRVAGPLNNLAGVSGDNQLDGQGTTSRDIVISTTLTARVAGVLPNGAMVVEASKDVGINSESQVITVRGVVRPAPIPPVTTGPCATA